MKTPSAFIVDDHAAIIFGLTRLFDSASIAVKGSASSVEAALRTFLPKADTALILDLNFGSARGTEPIETVLSRFPDAKIIVYSVHESLPTVSASYTAGAKAFIGKSIAPDLLIEAVRAVTSTNALYYPPGLAETIASYHANRHRTPNPRDVLSRRDFTLFLDLARGVSVGEIAERDGIHRRTLSNRILAIKKSLRVERSSFTLVARQFNLVD